MPDAIEIRVPAIPNIREVVLREAVLISLDSAAAEVRVETVYPFISRIPPPPPRVSSSCDRTRTWTISGSHRTGANATAEIHLNKFLGCVESVIRDVVVGPNDQPTVGGVIYSTYIGSTPSFVATPESESAVFLTCSFTVAALQPPPGQAFLPQALDVKVKVKSWNHNGAAAADIEFNWIAVAKLASVTNF